MTIIIGGNAQAAGGTVSSVWRGLNGELRSHSYGTIVNSGALASVSIVWATQLAKELLMNSMTLQSTAGQESIDILTSATVGSQIFTNGKAGLEIIDNITNDLFQDGGTPTGITQYKNALRSTIWLLLAYTKSTDSGINGVYTVSNGRIELTNTAIFSAGGATEAAANEYSGGSAIYSDSNGAVATFTVDGSDILLFLGGRKDGVGGINNGIARITVDGVQYGSDVDLSNTFRQSTFSGTKYRAPYCVPLLNIGSGSHTITVTNTGASGTRLTLDFWSRLSNRQPEICVMHQPYFAAGTYNQQSSQAGIDSYNAAVDAVVAEFVGYPVNVVSVNDGWDPETMMSDVQLRHPNDLGVRHYVDSVIYVIKDKSGRVGIQNI